MRKQEEKKKKSKISKDEKKDGKEKKVDTKWEDGKITKKDLEELDLTRKKRPQSPKTAPVSNIYMSEGD